jgi:uncharacterized SAM-binding protein YcdF (DUF218 family)
MGEVLEFFFSIEGVIAALVVSGVGLLLRPKSIGARAFPLVLGILYVTASIYAVPAAFARLLTRGYHPFVASDAGPGPTAIVVLGGGCQTVGGWNGERTAVLAGDSAARVLEAARISRELPNAIVISSGGAPSPDDDETAVALVMRDQLVALGVARSRILVENDSRDTHDEAVAIDPMLRARKIRQVVLVTSDVHMRRSVGTFAEAGWKVIPAIAPNPNFGKPLRRRMVPSSMGLAFSSAVAHEACGIPYYWARGWFR